MNDNPNLTEYVTFTAGGQLFGLPIERVQDVFRPANITRVPLAGTGDRGRAQSARPHRHGDPPVGAARFGGQRQGFARLGRDGDRHRIRNSKSFGLLVDSVGEVLKLADGDREPNPINLDRKLARVSSGVFRLDGELLVVLDVDRVLDLGAEAAAA